MKDLNSTSITHSPYYGCTIQVISNANISYIGVLDSISINKDRLYLKNAQVKANIIDNSDRGKLKILVLILIHPKHILFLIQIIWSKNLVN